MFGSQALETAVGLALLFFVLSNAASAIVEALSRVLQKRANDLEGTLAIMLSGSETATDGRALENTPAMRALRGTSVYSSALAAARQVRRFRAERAKPAYLSARAFADAVTEMMAADGSLAQAPGAEGLQRRLQAITTEIGDDVLDMKAGLESWFDETMGRLEDAYKRWVTAVLFVVGLVIAVGGNVSTIHAAEGLWEQPVTRQVAIDAATAQNATDAGGTVSSPAEAVQSVEDLEELGFPVGWRTHPTSVGGWLTHVVGWLITALLLMLGAPFWFDILSRLVQLRTTGAKPPTAARDDASATSLRAAASAAPALTPTAVGLATGPVGQAPVEGTAVPADQGPADATAAAQPPAPAVEPTNLVAKVREAVQPPS